MARPGGVVVMVALVTNLERGGGDRGRERTQRKKERVGVTRETRARRGEGMRKNKRKRVHSPRWSTEKRRARGMLGWLC
jgi:hypothetical protein